jgi:hypothetical protein
MGLVLFMGRSILGPIKVDGLAFIAILTPMGYYWAVIRFIARVVFAALLLRAAWCG